MRMPKLGLTALAFAFAVPALGQQNVPASGDRLNRPGGTTQIAPSPGPATSPALPSPAMPQAAVQNREDAQSAKAARKAQKKSRKVAPRTPVRDAPANAPSGSTSSTAPTR